TYLPGPPNSAEPAMAPAMAIAGAPLIVGMHITLEGDSCLLEKEVLLGSMFFKTVDLYNWKSHSKGLQVSPQEFITHIWRIFSTHNPTWPCVQTLTATLLAEDKSATMAKTEEEADNIYADNLVTCPVEVSVPIANPNWDPNDDKNQEWLHHYRNMLLRGMREASQLLVNWGNLRETEQGPNENPSAFLN
uniref:Core shell protein Gag P30 domain-containing protein n=1 Tax=Colobus angolensis palliatus TaxID=336983 RepID=A0A2K5HWD8_COLAP